MVRFALAGMKLLQAGTAYTSKMEQEPSIAYRDCTMAESEKTILL